MLAVLKIDGLCVGYYLSRKRMNLMETEVSRMSQTMLRMIWMEKGEDLLRRCIA